MNNGKINIDKPRYDQSTYTGRAKHFFITTNPLNLFTSNDTLDKCKEIVDKYRKGEVDPNLTEDELWRSKQLYDSAFHPDTGEKMFMMGRMSFQVPGNMIISGGMMHFYKSLAGVLFWQWTNQTYNAVVNYTNRSGDKPLSMARIATSYVCATTGAISTALFINHQVRHLPPLVGRMVPFVAVAAANCINIPCMRSQELTDGITVTDHQGQTLGQSPVAARQAITQVTMSRVVMAVPGMTVPPIFMNMLDKKGYLARYRWISLPLQIALCGMMLTFATPLSCALFPQQSSIATSRLEEELQKKLRDQFGADKVPDRVYYNKGL